MPYVTILVNTNNQTLVAAVAGKSIKVIAFHYNLDPGAGVGLWWDGNEGQADRGHFYGYNGSGSDSKQWGLNLGDKSLFIGPVGKALEAYSNTTAARVTIVYRYV